MYELRIINSQNEETFSFKGMEAEIITIDIQSLIEVGSTIFIIDLATGEIIDEFTIDSLDSLEGLELVADDDCCEDPDCLECGFDPYMGCYSDDC